MRSDDGFGLIELMISMALSCLLMALLVALFFSSRQHYDIAQTIMQRQSDRQLVNELLRNSIRGAGFTPCRGLTHLQTHGQAMTAVRLNVGEHKALELSRMGEPWYKVATIINPSGLQLETTAGWAVGQRLLLADCFHAEVVTVAHSDRTRVYLERPTRFSYSGTSYLGPWLQERFYTRLNSDNAQALYYETRHAEELSEHVTRLNASLSQTGLLRVDLQDDAGKTWLLQTRMRNP